MSNGSWQPDPYGRHQLRWWDGAQWTSMVSNNGVNLDENAPQQPMMQQPMGMQPMGMPGVTPVMTPTPPKRNNALIAIIAVVVLAAAGVGVYLLTKDDKGSDKVSSGTATTMATTGTAGTTGTGGTTQPITSVTFANGHDSQTPEGQAYVDAMMLSSGESGFSEDQARCVAEGAVDIVGVQALKDAGVTPDMVASGSELLPDFTPTEAQANAMLDMMFGCVDFGELMVSEMAGVQLPADQVQCIGDALETNETFRAFMVTTMISSTSVTVDTTDIQMDLTTAMLEIFTTCGVDPGSLGG